MHAREHARPTFDSAQLLKRPSVRPNIFVMGYITDGTPGHVTCGRVKLRRRAEAFRLEFANYFVLHLVKSSMTLYLAIKAATFTEHGFSRFQQPRRCFVTERPRRDAVQRASAFLLSSGGGESALRLYHLSYSPAGEAQRLSECAVGGARATALRFKHEGLVLGA
jgi:hypothetical protein